MAHADTSRVFDEEEATNDYSSYWQSIPSPPPPSAAEAGKHPTTGSTEEGPRRCHERKRSIAFRDVTNHQVLNGGASDLAPGKPAAAASMKAPESEQNSLGGDEDGAGEDGDEIVEKRRKKRKKRQRRSLLLPSEHESGAGHPWACSDTTGTTDEDSCVAPKNDFEQSGNLATRNEILVQLVRDFCSLPADRGVNSKEAREIEGLSEYPMPGKVRPVMSNAISKEEFLLRVQPIVQAMEHRKQRDVTDTKLATQCEVQKDRKGGYSYYDVNSGEQIPADEYKLRYSSMIDERRKERKESINQTNSLEDEEAKKVHVDRKDIEKQGNSDDSNMDESVNMDDSMFSPDDSVIPDDESCDPTINVYPVGPGDSPGSKGSPTNNSADPTVDPIQNEYNCDSHPLFAGMPTSNDPRVLEARRKLWRAIDTALANYSEEILTIEQEVDGADTNS
eukprot:CAMPEP_0181104018 /NCGR_PEP_ID=MMETSP1071-20121207/15193_1 /TAXON_ID=35127 /ORGANISM="Thalassiosira sp., Strain NH16" /LENGTH=447 /DNA_ID=CAMNT_0023187167 /DNA_START=51 /DNA_END=1394 /DNA_ORIENTATION=+